MPWPFKKKDKLGFDPKDKTVLVVDDESDIRTVVEGLLAGHGYRIIQAKDGADIMMPRMDGYQVMEALKSTNPELPVVMLTAKTAQQDVWKGYVEGCHYYVTKPFEAQTLIRAVNYLLSDLSDPQRRDLEQML